MNRSIILSILALTLTLTPTQKAQAGVIVGLSTIVMTASNTSTSVFDKLLILSFGGGATYGLIRLGNYLINTNVAGSVPKFTGVAFVALEKSLLVENFESALSAQFPQINDMATIAELANELFQLNVEAKHDDLGRAKLSLDPLVTRAILERTDLTVTQINEISDFLN